MDLEQFLANHVRSSSQQRWFIHFTDRSNLASIRKYGLLSMQELTRRKIPVEAPGGNQWSHEQDERTGMDAYVHLCFKTGHPMEKPALDDGRITNLVRLQIHPDVIKLPGVNITDDVSNKVGVSVETAATMLDKIDLEVLYKRLPWKDPAIRQRLVVAAPKKE